ncbi:hypothetical protein GCM10020331_044300 [Ectobacillus funiculus]
MLIFLKDRLRKECHEFIVHEKKRKLENIYALTERLRSRISTAMAKQKKIESFNKWLMTLSEEVTDCSFRLYVCDEDGFQKSGNLVKENGQWELVPEYEQKNWSWRPYFFGKYHANAFLKKKGRLSDLYTDIDTGEMVRTFFVPD